MNAFVKNSIVIILALSGLTACRSIPCGAPLPTDQASEYRWGCARSGHASKASARNISVTNQANGALTVLFTNGGITSQPPMRKLTDRWTSYLDLPVVSSSTSPQRLRCQVRGAVMKPAGSHASALIDVGGGSIAFDFPVAEAHDEPISGDVEFTTPVGNKETFPVSVLVTVTRSSPDDAVALDIDSIDCSVIPPAP